MVRRPRSEDVGTEYVPWTLYECYGETQKPADTEVE